MGKVDKAAILPLTGSLRVPSDKSIAHRRILLAACKPGTTNIEIYRCGNDLKSSINALRCLGCVVELHEIVNTTYINIVTPDKLRVDAGTIDCGNSGTTMRLLCGLLAGLRIKAILTGDDSLSKRPMERVMAPLKLMGADIQTGNDGCPPIRINSSKLEGIRYRLEVNSAQVKSALLIAGLFAEGKTVIIEPIATRDHTEILLGIKPQVIDNENHWTVDSKTDIQNLSGQVPGDISNAAYWISAALIRKNSNLTISNVGLNPTRAGFIKLLNEQNANISFSETNVNNGEHCGDIRVHSGGSLSFDISKNRIPGLIDEIPLIAVLAACTQGSFELSGAVELRYKESDRITATVTGLKLLGVDVVETIDGFRFAKTDKIHNASISSFNDHRIVMSFAIAGFALNERVNIQNHEITEISYPDFNDTLDQYIYGSIKLGLLGRSISFSLSPSIHTKTMQSLSIPGSYKLIDLSEDNLPDVLNELHDDNYRGMNVTIPFKQCVMPYLESISDIATKVGAVNTLIRQNSGWFGDNTDVAGFKYALSLFPDEPNRKTSLVLGAGGAARAVVYALIESGWKVIVTSRKPEQSSELTDSYDANADVSVLSWNERHDVLADMDLMVNATPVGMQGEPASPLEFNLINDAHHLWYIDIVYSPRETPLAKHLSKNGAQVQNGLPMLIGQASESFRLWQGVTFPQRLKMKMINRL